MRRQNHSCSYCRKSKKACDGFTLNRDRCAVPADGYPLIRNESQHSRYGLLPCSYCVRTKKECSLNSKWGKSSGSGTIPSATESAGGQTEATKRLKAGDEYVLPSPTFNYDLELSLDDISLALSRPDPVASALPSPSSPGLANLSCIQAPNAAIGIPPLGIEYPGNSSSIKDSNHDDGLEHWTDLLGSVESWNDMDLPNLTDQPASQGPQDDAQPSLWAMDDLSQQHTDYSLSSSHSNLFSSLGKRKALASSQFDERSLSVYSLDFAISAAANNHLIIGNLLGIYHDVLENNLACWLAEENCPYKMRQGRREPSTGGRELSPISPAYTSPLGEGGIKAWGNRIYRRVTRLDRIAMQSKQLRITRPQSHAASRALSLVIMAFATQWSQGQRRGQMQSPGYSQGGRIDSMETEFERHLQQSVWRQARAALQEVDDVECFRVAYAEMVFGLMEKPRDEEDEFATADEASDAAAEVMPCKVLDMLAQDGPPVMLERAARKMQVLKFRFEAKDTRSLCDAACPTSRAKSMGDEDRETIGLLYWLAVMFDTVSAPMNERPVALADEECQHDSVKEDSSVRDIGQEPTDSRSHLRWNVQTFTRRDHDIASGSLRWPCPHDVAAAAIARSAPIKILIFRHLSYLQNILRRKEFGQPMEDALWEATLVYRYWNTIYAPLYRDLVENYETVPTRIRAWFVCIYVPWHLACLMFADVVELVEQNKFGLSAHSHTRARADMVSRIRKQSAFELSELARVTAPGDGIDQLPDYHHAVNEGPLLTEPWTVLLVRAFSKCALFYLGAASGIQRETEDETGCGGQEVRFNRVRAEYCIKALLALGRKSTMARQISGALSIALDTRSDF